MAKCIVHVNKFLNFFEFEVSGRFLETHALKLRAMLKAM